MDTATLLPGDRVEFVAGRHDGLTGIVTRVRSTMSGRWYDVAVVDGRTLWLTEVDVVAVRILAHV